MNTWLVSGINGFVGGHLKKYIEDKGDIAVGIPRNIFNDPVRLERFVQDINPDVIVHLAAYGNHYRQKDILECLEVNYTGTFNLLQVTQDIPYKAFINISTSSVTLPHQTFYSATKMGAEMLCRAFASEFNLPVTTLRPFSLYGIGEADFRFIPTVFRSCLKGEEMKLAPEPVHDWTPVEFFCEVIGIVANEMMEGKLKNYKGRNNGVGTGIGVTNQEVVSMIERITGKKAKIKKVKSLRKYDSGLWVCPNPYGSAPTLEQGLTRYYEWYKLRGGEHIHGRAN